MATDEEDEEEIAELESKLDKLVAFLQKGGIIPPL